MSTNSKVQKITPYLWFEDQAEQAAQLYSSIFPDGKILEVQRYGDAGPGPKGTAMVVTFQIAGLHFYALNGGLQHKFTEAISFLVTCESQQEVDRYWGRLTADGGEPGRCGWLKDRYGVSWQIIPTALTRLMSDPDLEKAGRVVQAMLQMGKIEIAGLERAHAGM
jgi:predicted 3-demethylubiquinone-9 3-methyltransferase (glyoxalase superfamily)